MSRIYGKHVIYSQTITDNSNSRTFMVQIIHLEFTYFFKSNSFIYHGIHY